jgi:hypothetical protein
MYNLRKYGYIYLMMIHKLLLPLFFIVAFAAQVFAYTAPTVEWINQNAPNSDNQQQLRITVPTDGRSSSTWTIWLDGSKKQTNTTSQKTTDIVSNIADNMKHSVYLEYKIGMGTTSTDTAYITIPDRTAPNVTLIKVGNEIVYQP